MAVLTLLLSLPLPLLLLYYPAVPALMKHVTDRSLPIICHKLAPVFDVFQSAYKPKLRFFAAFPLFYRILIWVIFSTLFTVERSYRQAIISFALVIILAIHSVVQPYKNPMHNYIETLYLVNLVILSMTATAVLATLTQRDANVFFFILVNLPVVVGAVYFLWKCKCSKQCRAACKKFKQNRAESVQTTESQVTELLPSEVYLDMNEVEQSTQP